MIQFLLPILGSIGGMLAPTAGAAAAGTAAAGAGAAAAGAAGGGGIAALLGKAMMPALGAGIGTLIAGGDEKDVLRNAAIAGAGTAAFPGLVSGIQESALGSSITRGLGSMLGMKSPLAPETSLIPRPRPSSLPGSPGAAAGLPGSTPPPARPAGLDQGPAGPGQGPAGAPARVPGGMAEDRPPPRAPRVPGGMAEDRPPPFIPVYGGMAEDRPPPLRPLPPVSGGMGEDRPPPRPTIIGGDTAAARPNLNLFGPDSPTVQDLMDMDRAAQEEAAAASLDLARRIPGESELQRLIRQREEQARRGPMGGRQGFAKGGAIKGPGTGTSDSVPAQIYQNGRPVSKAALSDGEFVMTAKAVRGAGNGDRQKGVNRMYELMRRFEQGEMR